MFAVEMTHKFGWHSLGIKTDSSYVDLMVKNKSHNVPWKIRNKWIRALRYVTDLNVHISHIYREGTLNKSTFNNIKLNFLSSKAWVLGSIEKINKLVIGCMHNSQDDLIALNNIGAKG